MWELGWEPNIVWPRNLVVSLQAKKEITFWKRYVTQLDMVATPQNEYVVLAVGEMDGIEGTG